MASVLIRDLEEGTVEQLKARAQRNGRSLQGELKLILEQAAAGTLPDHREMFRRLDRMLAGRTFSDSAELVREDRER